MPRNAIWIILIIILLCAVFPVFPYSRSWGYGPTGGVGAIILVLVVLWALGLI
jgi:hypothetical protein